MYLHYLCISLIYEVENDPRRAQNTQIVTFEQRIQRAESLVHDSVVVRLTGALERVSECAGVDMIDQLCRVQGVLVAML